MTRKIHYLLAIVFVAFLATSCKKDNGNNYPNETKIDIKGSLMKPDQRTEDVTAGLNERTLYVRFFKDYDETEVSILSLNGEKHDVTPEERIFTMRNYWYPFAMDDVAALGELRQNPVW